MKEDWKRLGTFQLYLIVSIIVGMIWALPLMWAWNYTMTYLFNLKTITWLHAWLLISILSSLWKISVVSNINNTKEK